MNLYLDKLIEDLEKVFPNRLPTYSQNYNADNILLSIGQQEVLTYLRKLQKKENT